jgi:hypothetical protein
MYQYHKFHKKKLHLAAEERNEKTTTQLRDVLKEVCGQVFSCSELSSSVDNYFTRQYIAEDNYEHHTRRRENLKSHRYFLTSQHLRT